MWTDAAELLSSWVSIVSIDSPRQEAGQNPCGHVDIMQTPNKQKNPTGLAKQAAPLPIHDVFKK